MIVVFFSSLILIIFLLIINLNNIVNIVNSVLEKKTERSLIKRKEKEEKERKANELKNIIKENEELKRQLEDKIKPSNDELYVYKKPFISEVKEKYDYITKYWDSRKDYE